MIHVACRINDHHALMITQAGRDRSPDIKDKAIYELSELSGIVIVQSFCEIARTAEYGWPGMDTCCIHENSNTELQESIKIQIFNSESMFTSYRHLTLAIAYLCDVLASFQPGVLAKSAWNPFTKSPLKS
jgi:hypothetical protein